MNYDPAHAPQDGRPDGHWHVDSGDILLGREEPGPPAQRGIWDSGCLLVRQYEFAEPRILARPTGPPTTCSAGTCCSRAGSSA